jgi:2-iminobutanoate/2-iminopropanoate deaminase
MSRVTSATAKAKGPGGSPSKTSGRAQITTSRAPLPTGPYSQAIVANGFVFVSGQRPVDPASGLIPSGIGAQTRQVMTNLSAVLEAAGTTLGDVVKVAVHLADLSMFEAFNVEYGQWFEPSYPTRTTVGSELRGILVEVDVVAVQGQPGAGTAR